MAFSFEKVGQVVTVYKADTTQHRAEIKKMSAAEQAAHKEVIARLDAQAVKYDKAILGVKKIHSSVMLAAAAFPLLGKASGDAMDFISRKAQEGIGSLLRLSTAIINTGNAWEMSGKAADVAAIKHEQARRASGSGLGTGWWERTTNLGATLAGGANPMQLRSAMYGDDAELAKKLEEAQFQLQLARREAEIARMLAGQGKLDMPGDPRGGLFGGGGGRGSGGGRAAALPPLGLSRQKAFGDITRRPDESLPYAPWLQQRAGAGAVPGMGGMSGMPLKGGPTDAEKILGNEHFQLISGAMTSSFQAMVSGSMGVQQAMKAMFGQVIAGYSAKLFAVGLEQSVMAAVSFGTPAMGKHAAAAAMAFGGAAVLGALAGKLGAQAPQGGGKGGAGGYGGFGRGVQAGTGGGSTTIIIGDSFESESPRKRAADLRRRLERSERDGRGGGGRFE